MLSNSHFFFSTFLLFCFFLSFGTCKEEPTYDDDVLTVHIIPHSHCDPGWLTTFEWYYEGQVKGILNNLYDELMADPSKTFVWAEISFFNLWWNQQNEERKKNFAQLVEEGRLEFVGGGWVQNDEATAHFDQVLEQVTEGHEFLRKHFNVRPRIAWQIDPFGHSSLTPTLFSLIGYEGLVINRIHYGLKDAFKSSQSMEFVWRPSVSYGEETQMLTTVLHTHYSAPMGYDWEEGSPSIMDTGDYTNVDQRGADFVSVMKDRAQSYRTKHLLVPWGDDFKFRNARTQYNNMDKLIKHINKRSEIHKVKVIYSTLSQYFDAVNDYSQRNQVKFPAYSGDFFPYADNGDSYWTGYYTTRPSLKRRIRETGAVLRAAEILFASTFDSQKFDEQDMIKLEEARRNLALIQHHDGVTGTSKQDVANDYMSKLGTAIETSEKLMDKSIRKMSKSENLKFLRDFNEELSIEPGKDYRLMVFNPLAFKIQQVIHVRVNTASVDVFDGNGSPVQIQVDPVFNYEPGNRELETISDPSLFDLHFYVQLDGLSLQSFYISSTKNPPSVVSPQTYISGTITHPTQKRLGRDQIWIGNSFFNLTFNPDGTPDSLASVLSGTSQPFHLTYFQYETSRSGAYIFRDDGRTPQMRRKEVSTAIVIKGSLSQTVIQFGHGMTTTYRLTKGSPFLSLQHRLRGSGGTETVVRYSSDLASAGKYWAYDGLETRQRSHFDQPPRSYAPATSAVLLRDTTREMVVMTDRSCGVTSNAPGSLEVMIHRNLNHDDGRGLGEGVHDNDEILVSHSFLLQSPNKPWKHLQLALEHPFRIFFEELETSISSHYPNFPTSFSLLSESFPAFLHLETLRVRDLRDSNERVVRLISYEEDPTIAALFDLTKLFAFEFNNFELVSPSLNSYPQDIAARKIKYNIDNWLQSEWNHMGNNSNLAKQNSNEAGVFLSKEALEKMKEKDKNKQNSNEEGVFVSKIALDMKNKEKGGDDNKVGRNLLNVEEAPSSIFEIRSLRMFTFLLDAAPIDENFGYHTFVKREQPQQPEEEKIKVVEGEQEQEQPKEEQPKEEQQQQQPPKEEQPQVNEPSDKRNSILSKTAKAHSGSTVSKNEVRFMVLIAIVSGLLLMLVYWRIMPKRKVLRQSKQS